MAWSVVKLTDEDIRKCEGYRLQTQFEGIFATALAPQDAAMFGNLDPDEDNHLFYFSPQATEIFSRFLNKYASTACDAPAKESVALLVGRSDAQDRML
ncbi:MAG TPA: hypothetical protein VHZ53_17590 [Steroidobacteraceae bacterium]|jgi:hypothetical protein|nr:hypothetical protein [Steroidobacteraceae bacterium]